MVPLAAIPVPAVCDIADVCEVAPPADIVHVQEDRRDRFDGRLKPGDVKGASTQASAFSSATFERSFTLCFNAVPPRHKGVAKKCCPMIPIALAVFASEKE